MGIQVYDKQTDLPLSQKSVEESVLSFLKSRKLGCELLEVHFVTEKEIAKLHKKYFDDPSPTDCISFPIDTDPLIGTLFICPKTALAYVEKHGGDPYAEVTLYLIHGLLHLLGYDDQTEEEEKVMRQEEKVSLERLIKSKKGISPRISQSGFACGS